MANAEAGKIDSRLSDQTTSFHDQIEEVRRVAEESLRYSKNLHDQLTQAGSPLELQNLVRQNTETLQHVYSMVHSIKKWIRWQKVWFWVKVFLVIVPTVWAIIYLPPLIQQWVKPYQALFNVPAASSGGSASALDPKILQAIQKLQSDPKKLQQVMQILAQP